MVFWEEGVSQHPDSTATANSEYLSGKDRGFIPTLLSSFAITDVQNAQILCSAGSSRFDTAQGHCLAQPAALLQAHMAKHSLRAAQVQILYKLQLGSPPR